MAILSTEIIGIDETTKKFKPGVLLARILYGLAGFLTGALSPATDGIFPDKRKKITGADKNAIPAPADSRDAPEVQYGQAVEEESLEG